MALRCAANNILFTPTYNHFMIGAIILAAGASTRLGVPKQTLLYGGKTLLQHAAEAAQGAGCHPVIIVLGAQEDAILSHFHYQSALIVHNHDWHQGMGTSIATGMKALLQADCTVANVIIMVCDQPFADATLLQKLIEQQKQTGKGITASTYADTMGVPALFNKPYFDALLHLSGDEGAKKIMLRHQEDVERVPFEKGVIDIDTIKDVEEFKKHE
jgi:molybdenum cofactor cytidylyltransferase